MVAPHADSSRRLEEIRTRIAQAAKRAGRSADSVRLVGVSKTVQADAIHPLLAAGLASFGENRVQEALGKWPPLCAAYPGTSLHLVGQLQSNKAEDAVGVFDTIHSVDRLSLVQALGKAVARLGRAPDCFLQARIADEPQKGGCAIAELPALLDAGRHYGLHIVGLMCVPPVGRNPAPYFALLADLARRLDLPRLSMGMTADFETAIELGATDIRIGTALFGTREQVV